MNMEDDWSIIESDVRDMFARSYFTNHGPIVRSLEKQLAEATKGYALAFANHISGLMSWLASVKPSGAILISEETGSVILTALKLFGAGPIHCVGHKKIEHKNGNSDCMRGVSAAILTINRSSGLSHIALEKFRRSAQLYSFPVLLNINSVPCLLADHDFDHLYVMANEREEGSILITKSLQTQRFLRTSRSFHSDETLEKLDLRLNGKMSEMQAILARARISQIHRHKYALTCLQQRLVDGLSNIQDIIVVQFHDNLSCYYWDIEILVDLSSSIKTCHELKQKMLEAGILAETSPVSRKNTSGNSDFSTAFSIRFSSLYLADSENLRNTIAFFEEFLGGAPK